jgi:hypothetical protein
MYGMCTFVIYCTASSYTSQRQEMAAQSLARRYAELLAPLQRHQHPGIRSVPLVTSVEGGDAKSNVTVSESTETQQSSAELPPGAQSTVGVDVFCRRHFQEVRAPGVLSPSMTTAAADGGVELRRAPFIPQVAQPSATPAVSVESQLSAQLRHALQMVQNDRELLALKEEAVC